MTTSSRSEFVVDDEFVLRTPLLPLDELWGGDEPSASAPPRSPQERRRWIEERSRDPVVREAIACASPSLVEALDAELRPGSAVERAVGRYLVRMASRPTLFGLFAGTSVGRFDQDARLHLGRRADYRRCSTPHAPHLLELARSPLVGDGWLDVPCCVVATALVRGDRVELSRRGEDGPEAICVEGAEVVAVLEAVAGAPSDPAPRAVAETLARSRGGSPARWQEVIALLLEHGALLDHRVPPVTGPSLAEALIEELDASPGTRARAEVIDRIREAAARLDAGGLVPEPGAVERMRGHYRRALGRAPGRLADVHLLKPAALTLPRSLRADIERAVEALARFGARPCPSALIRFRDRFVERYGDRRVPLLRCFDPIDGLVLDASQGFSARAVPLLDGMPLESGEGQPEVEATWSARDALLLERLREVWSRGTSTLELDERDLAAVEPSFDVSSAVLRAQLLGSPREPRLLACALVGPSGAELFAQVRHVCPPVDAMARRQIEHDRRHHHDDAIIAELCHAAEPVADAVIRRPRDAGYELICWGRSGAELDRRIPVSDLDACVEQGEVRLYSRRLGRRVIPRLSCNHDYPNADLPLYRLLGLLQRTDAARYHRWSWGALASCRRLPRVCLGRIVLSPARWRLDRTSLEELRADPTPAWARAHQLPRWLWVESIDPPLLVDTDDPAALEGLAHATARSTDAVLTECLLAREGSAVRGVEGSFANELLVPLRRRRNPSSPSSSSVVRTPDEPDRRWLYLRIFGNPNAIDGLLAGPLGETVAQLTRADSFERVHLLYHDEPRFHLRLRLRGEPDWLQSVALGRLWARAGDLLTEGTIAGVELDTYVPELDRYGGPEGVDLAERIHDADTRAVIAVRRAWPDEDEAPPRWLLAAGSTDRLAADLGLSPADREALFGRLATARWREFGGGTALRRAVGRKHRELRARLEPLVIGGGGLEALTPRGAVLDERSERMAPLRRELDGLSRAEGSRVRRGSFVDAIVHLHVNRMMPRCARAQELVLYGLLQRVHASWRARSRRRDPQTGRGAQRSAAPTIRSRS